MGLMSSDGSNLLARLRPTGWPTLAVLPSRTASTKLGWVGVPSTLLKTEMQPAPHCGVAAFAVPETAALTPATHVSVATAVSTFLLIDSRWVDDELMTDLPSEDLTVATRQHRGGPRKSTYAAPDTCTGSRTAQGHKTSPHER